MDGNDVDEAIDSEEKVAAYDGPDRVVHFTDYEKLKTGAGPKAMRFYTQNFRQFDSLLEGVETGELITITGPTGNGKTLLAESIGLSLMNQGVGVTWFSFEVQVSKLIEKYKDQESLGLFVPMEMKAGNFKWIIERALESKLKHGCRAIIIDHLHFLVDMDTKQNMSLNIGAVLRQLKKSVALDMNLLVILLAHQQQGNDDREPGLNSIRDSSFIAQESDTVLTVYRTADPAIDENKKSMATSFEQGWATVKIDKARRAGTYRKKLTFQKRGNYLEEF